MTHLELIDRLGIKGVASACNVDVTTVHHWKRRGIPGRYWPAVARLSEGKISLEVIAAGSPLVEKQDAA